MMTCGTRASRACGLAGDEGVTSQEGSELFQRVWAVVQEMEGPPCPVSWEGASPRHN